MLFARLVAWGMFKGVALLASFVLIVALWVWDASLLTYTADANLQLLKVVTNLLPADSASKVESALCISAPIALSSWWKEAPSPS